VQAPPVPLTREQKAEQARVAGAKGRTAAPMSGRDRAEHYFATNGCRGLTPAQRRRWRRKILRGGAAWDGGAR